MKEVVNEKLKVCMAMDAYLPYVDGVVNCMDHYLTEMVKKEDAFALAPKHKNAFDEKLPYEVLRCKSFCFPVIKAMYGFPNLDKKFKKAVKEKDIDIIHLHSPFNMANYAIKLAKKKNIPIVATFHSNFRPILRDIIKIPFIAEWCVKYIGRKYNKMDEVFCVSEGVAKQARSFGYTGKITLLPFGTELERVSDIDGLKDNANKTFNLAGDEIVFLFVGRIMNLKRIDFIINSLKKVKEKGFNFKFFVVGKGPEEKNLKELVKRLNLEDHVIFTGFLDRELFPLIYARADLFLFPSLYDNFGLVKVESATFDTPGLFIKNSQAGLGVIDNQNGFLAEDSLEDFSNKIIFAISDKENLKRVGKTAGETLYLSWSDCTEKLIDRYKEIISRKEKPKKVKFTKEEKKEIKAYIKEENKKHKLAKKELKKD
ncbi:MAG: glycosyltransferase [Clostridia bacterium]|nr:glycosyltransferase [Clostridia bacterium]